MVNKPPPAGRGVSPAWLSQPVAPALALASASIQAPPANAASGSAVAPSQEDQRRAQHAADLRHRSNLFRHLNPPAAPEPGCAQPLALFERFNAVLDQQNLIGPHRARIIGILKILTQARVVRLSRGTDALTEAIVRPDIGLLAQEVFPNGVLDNIAAEILAAQAQLPLPRVLEALGYVGLAIHTEHVVLPNASLGLASPPVAASASSGLPWEQVKLGSGPAIDTGAPQPPTSAPHTAPPHPNVAADMDFDALLALGDQIHPAPELQAQPPRKRPRMGAAQPVSGLLAELAPAVYAINLPTGDTPQDCEQRLNACAEQHFPASPSCPGSTPLARTLNQWFGTFASAPQPMVDAPLHALTLKGRYPLSAIYASMVYQVVLEKFLPGYPQDTPEKRTLYAKDMAHLAALTSQFATDADPSGTMAAHTAELSDALLAQFHVFGVRHIPTLIGIRKHMILAGMDVALSTELLLDFSRAVQSYINAHRTSESPSPGTPIEEAKALLLHPDPVSRRENVFVFIGHARSGFGKPQAHASVHKAWLAHEYALP
jgi:hypothetical protein